MAETVLITGGAGFIGSHLADELLRSGYRVRALDNLEPQVHGDNPARPWYLAEEVEFLPGDIRDPEAVREALRGADSVIHLAARVGVGQSMYDIADYTSTNNVGTAVLLEAIIAEPVKRLLLASSMSIYGEGLYRTPDGEHYENARRGIAQLRRGEWEPELQGKALTPIPTPEDKRPELASVYALSKYDQERLCLMTGEAYDIPTTALRFFNVYGPRQALSNPYTGVLAIFASRLLNDKPPLIYEDGRQRRDFISVHDLARACRLALESREAANEVVNIGSGESYTVREIAEAMAANMGKSWIRPEITGKYRVGDIRHCFADISKARRLLNFIPEVSLEQGLEELTEWLTGQQAFDQVEIASRELEKRGLALQSR